MVLPCYRMAWRLGFACVGGLPSRMASSSERYTSTGKLVRTASAG